MLKCNKNFEGDDTLIEPEIEIGPTIYAYITPNNLDNRGFIKIGYVEKQSADERIRQQTQTAHLKAVKLWEFPARFLNSTKTFTDKDFHRYLKRRVLVLRAVRILRARQV